jgi:hypothetical protein
MYPQPLGLQSFPRRFLDPDFRPPLFLWTFIFVFGPSSLFPRQINCFIIIILKQLHYHPSSLKNFTILSRPKQKTNFLIFYSLPSSLKTPKLCFTRRFLPPPPSSPAYPPLVQLLSPLCSFSPNLLSPPASTRHFILWIQRLMPFRFTMLFTKAAC